MKRTIIVSVVATLILVGSIVVFIKCTTESPATNEDIMELPDLAPHAEDDGYEYLAKLEAEEEKDEEVTNEPAKEVAEADSADAPEETILEDPYGMYVVTEDWLKQYGGYAVERNGKLYCFSGYVMGNVPEEYDVGFEVGGRGYEVTNLYVWEENKLDDVLTEAKGEMSLACGDFPIFKVSKNEEVRFYSSSQMSKFKFKQATFYGYGLFAGTATGVYKPVIDHVIGWNKGIVNASNTGVCDMNDNPVADVFNLEYGQWYKYCWYEGTEYHEISLIANSRTYLVDDDVIFDVPIQLTKNGYAVMNISNLAPGLYAREKINVFEITD